MTPLLVPTGIEIHPGVHPEWHYFGMTFNSDTIRVTIVSALIVLALGFWARRQLTKDTEDHVPTKLQLAWETVVEQVTTQVEDNLGSINPFVVPLAISLFFFILIANWIEAIPTELNSQVHVLPAPTADTNLTYAMAITTMIGVWVFGIRRQGLWGYLKHFYGQSIFPDKPVADVPIRIAFTFLNVLEELTKPITLALRLFGNIFAGGIMISLLGGLAAVSFAHIPVGGVAGGLLLIVWKLFDTMFLGALQAFIFALLTVLYFGMAGGHGHDEERDEADPPKARRSSAATSEPEPAH